jgi:hypothetical protein
VFLFEAVKLPFIRIVEEVKKVGSSDFLMGDWAAE